MKGIKVPEQTEDFTADPVELFFDLAYVFAFSQLVGRLIAQPNWSGVGRVALVFALLWLPWQQLTWAANAVSGNGRGVRLIFLAATAASVPMAASTSTALTGGGPVFAITLGVIMGLGFLTQTLSVERGSTFSRAVAQWVAPNAVAVMVLVAGSFVAGRGRLALWLVSFAIVLGAMIAAGRGEWLIRSGHFAERHALIVLIALGEVVVAIGVAVVHTLEAGAGLAVFCGGATSTGSDPRSSIAPRPSTRTALRGRFVRDVYTWAHAPIVAGIILAAAALEEITAHPTEHVAGEFRAMFLGGLALGVLGVAAAIWRAFRVLALERIAAGLAIALLLLVGGAVSGTLLLIAVDVVLAVTLAIEHGRIERGQVAEASASV